MVANNAFNQKLRNDAAADAEAIAAIEGLSVARARPGRPCHDGAQGKSNVMTMFWHMMLDFEPPLAACAVGEGDMRFSAVRATRQFVIAIPAVELAEKVVKIGNCSRCKVDTFVTSSSMARRSRSNPELS